MAIYKVSVTTLEKFRRVMAGLTSFDTEEALIETLKGIFKGNDKTFTGEAYHSLIEGNYSSENNHFLAGQILFTPAQAKAAFDFKKKHPSMVHEVNVKKVYHLGSMPILITGRVDGLEGIEIRDTKTKFGEPDFYDYMDSYQWRFYCDMLELSTFHYDIFEVKGFEQLNGQAPYKLDGVEFCEVQSLTLYPYANMASDCIGLLTDFMDYIKNRNFYHLLKMVDHVPA